MSIQEFFTLANIASALVAIAVINFLIYLAIADRRQGHKK